MHPLNLFVSWAVLLSWPTLVVAEDDPDYDASQNFRPDNVTGLGSLYSVVGSYYNATTKIKLMPTMGSSPGKPLCNALKNETAHRTSDSVMSITERGDYNKGDNSVNLWLQLIPDAKFNLSSAWYLDIHSPITWLMKSSPPAFRGYVLDDMEDYFDLNLTTTAGGAYDISATVNTTGSEGYPFASFNVSMPACNTTSEYDEWLVTVLDMTEWWSVQGWDAFTLPHVNGSFDANKVTLAMRGAFQANVWNKRVPGELQFADLGESVQGFVEMEVSGVLDAYHSDDLVVGKGSPSWLRTVGFNNESANIGYESGSGTLLSSGTMLVVSICLSAWTFLYAL